MGPAMAALAGNGQRTGEGRLSWPVFLLTLAAVTTSSLAEVEGLNRAGRRREEARRRHTEDVSGGNSQESLHQPGPRHAVPPTRKKRLVPGSEPLIAQPCLQLLANNSRRTFRKEYNSEPHTGIPWQAGLRRGSALEADGDSMLVREEGFYFVYSQVYYMDSTFAMGHVVIRRKRNVVGDEPQYVILFRCIQNMNPVHPYNTCYTGGIVKLEAGDHVELLIPRSTANVSLFGDTTFLGAVKLA
uniref:TNF superfamily member 13b n=1 Tax=Gasterosteus aculeatus aculeatus TaxID=481459 RepID=A0AAQ4R9Y4_GASAC